MSTTGKIAAKGCGKTGISDELVKRLHDQLGRKILCVVELCSESRSEQRSGDETVTLSILTCEPVSTPEAEAHLRELARLFSYDRGVDQGQLTFTDGAPGTEPDLATIVQAGKKFEPHPFLPVDAADDNPICDVCGQIEDRTQHADRSKMRDPFAVIQGGADDQDDEAEGEEIEGEWVDDEPLAGTGEAVLIDPSTDEETVTQPGDPLPVIDQDEGDDLPPAYDAER